VTDVLPRLSIQPEDVQLLPLSAITPWEGNPRRGNVEAIQKSLRRFGQQRPAVVQRSSNRIVAGNHLWHGMLAENAEVDALEAAGVKSGDEEWPTGLHPWSDILVALTDLEDTEARAYLLADNRISELGQNDEGALARWLADLVEEGAVDEALGYASRDIDRLLRSIATSGAEVDDAPALPSKSKTYVKPGALYAIGRHRLLVGDATKSEAYDRLLDGAVVNMMWTDPPYGVGYDGAGSSRPGPGQQVVEREPLANDADDEDALRTLLTASLDAALSHVKPGGAVYCAAPGGARSTVFMDVLRALHVYRQTIIWVKDTFVVRQQDYHWRHEPVHVGVAPKEKNGVKSASPVLYGWRAGAAHFFVADRTQDTVWEIARPRRSDMHPTMKPVELVERSILSSSKRGDLVLDPFAGSGTTLVACERTARAGFAMELDPGYAQVIIERMRDTFGIEAKQL